MNTDDVDEDGERPSHPIEPKGPGPAPMLMGVSDRWTQGHVQKIFDRPTPRVFFKPVPSLMDPKDWGADRFQKVHNGEPFSVPYYPDDIADLLAQRSPQALLRDLFRPVSAFGIEEAYYVETGYVPGDMAKHVIETGAAGRFKVAAVLPPPLHSSDALVDEQARYRTFLASEWKYEKPERSKDDTYNPYDEFGRLAPIEEDYFRKL